jgi:hypothetical protein
VFVVVTDDVVPEPLDVVLVEALTVSMVFILGS